MSRANGPLSPLSLQNDEFSRYRGPAGPPSAPLTPRDDFGNPYGKPSSYRSSPPSSQHASGSTDFSRPSAGSSMTRPPSNASSVGRSSDGRMGFGSRPSTNRDSSKSVLRPEGEEILQKHYGVLRQYLASSLRDDQGNIKPNRARDKLLRLSATQFMELSTDVYDELIRREDEASGRVRNVPPFLPPRNNFHPKRNQARQKLSTLPEERFKQLATDVFYELERRLPRIASGDHSRNMSMSSNASRGVRPIAMSGGYRGPNGSLSGSPIDDSIARPVQKTLQSNTIVPNKSTMIEDDDEDDDEDAFGLDKVVTGFATRDDGSDSPRDHERVRVREEEVAALKEKIDSLEHQLSTQSGLTEQVAELENQVRDKQAELDRLRPVQDALMSRHEDLQRELDEKVANAQRLQDNLQHELEALQQRRTQDEQEIRQLRSQLADRDHTDEKHDQQHEIAALQDQLTHQERLTTQVRDEAMNYLHEMRELSQQNDVRAEQEERLALRVSELEGEIQSWRARYAKIKAQNRSLRASTIGLGLSTVDTEALLQREGVLSEDGLVRDVDVTHFQMAVDDLLKVARQADTNRMLDGVKRVVVSVQAITSGVGTDGYPTPSPSPLSPDKAHQQPESVDRLQARVTGTANSLITATKQHAASLGLSPVVLLDAAASNLTASVVALVKTVGIRPSPRENDAHPDMDSYYDDQSTDHETTFDTRAPHLTLDTPPLHDEETNKSSSLGALNFGLGRSDSSQKAAAGNSSWFGGWSRKVSHETDASSAYSPDPAVGVADHGTDDYESYR